MSPDHAAILAVPIQLTTMVIEGMVGSARGRPVYGYHQTFNNLAVMFGVTAMVAVTGLIPFLGYELIARSWGLALAWDAGNPLHWAVVFAITDFAYYVRHRMAHRVALLWVIHAVHHQSREYNLSVATRVGWFPDAIVIGWPIALTGAPLEMVFPCWLAGNLYQYFQHTEQIGKLGFVDRILVTPSNHRAHHGSNPVYIDCNYGSFLLIWDRLFGSWVPEEEPVRYGVLSDLSTYDASENNFEPMRMLWRKVRAQPDLWTAAQVIVRPPGWQPGSGAVLPVMVEVEAPARGPTNIQVQASAALMLVLGGSLAAWLSLHAGQWRFIERIPWLIGVGLALAIAGVMLDARYVEPVPAPTWTGTVRAWVSAALLTLAGPEAQGPLKKLGRWLEPG